MSSHRYQKPSCLCPALICQLSYSLEGNFEGNVRCVSSALHGNRRRTASVRVNRRHSSRSWCCLHSVTASLDKRRVHAEKLWAISLSSTLWTLLSMVWQRSSAWRAEHISSTASPQQDLFYDHVNKARVWRPKAEAKGLLSKQYASACIHVHSQRVSICPYWTFIFIFVNGIFRLEKILWWISLALYGHTTCSCCRNRNYIPIELLHLKTMAHFS